MPWPPIAAGHRGLLHLLKGVWPPARSNGTRKNYGFITFGSEYGLRAAVRALTESAPFECSWDLFSGLTGQRASASSLASCAVLRLREFQSAPDGSGSTADVGLVALSCVLPGNYF